MLSLKVYFHGICFIHDSCIFNADGFSMLCNDGRNYSVGKKKRNSYLPIIKSWIKLNGSILNIDDEKWKKLDLRASIQFTCL